ncbi:MAG: shikimate kinase [Cyanobacteria bacterium P01_F01_bin.150]
MTDFSTPAPNSSVLGQRLLIVGNSCAGKSTLGAQLASGLNVPFVELDALN